jgi:predicted Rossmann fold nucleotide-binding protein DprA/Smf involved in DNA uptake
MQVDTPLFSEVIPVLPPWRDTFTVRDRIVAATSENKLN